MKTVWFLGLDESQKAEFVKTLQNNQTLFTQMLKILKAQYDTIERKGFKEEEYDSPNWVFKQAFHNGKLAAYREIAELIDIKKE